MKSSKWLIGLVAVVLMLTLAPSSFAQVQLVLTNTPAPREIDTNRHAITSDPTSIIGGILVSGTLFANSVLTQTDLTLTFGAPITSGIANNPCCGGGNVPNINEAIRIEAASGLFSTVTISTASFTNGTLTITLPGVPGGNVQSGSFRIVGVRLDVNGKSAPLVLISATLSSPSNNYFPPTTLPTLISALDKGLNATTGLVQGVGHNGTNFGTGVIFTTGPVPDRTASIVLNEGFAAAWRTPAQSIFNPLNDATNVQGVQIRLTIAGLPAGVTASISIPTATSSIPGITLSNPDFTGGSTVISLTSTNLAVIESIPLTLNFQGTATAPPLTPGGTVTVTGTLFPIGTGLTSGVPTITGGFPRFSQLDTASVIVANIVSPKTTLLLPYGVRLGSYDTGIAVANTTKDPFTSGGATPTNGTLVFSLFPRTDTGAGTAAAYTTSAAARPGVGLDANGNLVAGGTWSALLSQVIALSTHTGDFIGYVFIETNFLNAHGVAYLLTGSNISSGLPLLVLPQPVTSARRTDVESLGY